MLKIAYLILIYLIAQFIELVSLMNLQPKEL